MSRIDLDLSRMSTPALQEEAQRLRQAIRRHRDEKGHGRCWLDDQALYAVLPEEEPPPVELPPRNEFLNNCQRYWHDRQDPKGRKLRSRLLRRIAFTIAKFADIV